MGDEFLETLFEKTDQMTEEQKIIFIQSVEQYLRSEESSFSVQE